MQREVSAARAIQAHAHPLCHTTDKRGKVAICTRDVCSTAHHAGGAAPAARQRRALLRGAVDLSSPRHARARSALSSSDKM